MAHEVAVTVPLPQTIPKINDMDIARLLLDYITDVMASGPPENITVEEIVTYEGQELVIDGLEVQPTFVIQQEEETDTIETMTTEIARRKKTSSNDDDTLE